MTSSIMLVVAFCKFLLSSGLPLNINISFPFKIQDLASMIEPFCYCRILGSEIESSNFHQPRAPCEVADFRQVIQENLNELENVSMLYTKPRKFENLKYTCVLNIYYIKHQMSLHDYFMSSYKYANIENKTVNMQKKTFDMMHLLLYLHFIWMNIGDATRLLKLEMRSQYTFVILNQDKRIPLGFAHFTQLFLRGLRVTNWYSAMIVIPEKNYSRNNLQNTVDNNDNITAFLCVPHHTNDAQRDYYCQKTSHLNLQLLVKLRNMNFAPSCSFGSYQQYIFQIVMNRISKAGSNQNKLFEFLALIRKKNCNESSFFIHHAAKVDLWQESSGMSQIDIYMVAEICDRLNYSTNPDTFSEREAFISIFPPDKYAEFSGQLTYKQDNEDYGNSAGVQYEDYWALSCYRIPTLSFTIYTIPFNLDLWITLLVTFVFVFKTFHVYANVKIRNAFSFCLFFYSSLVNNCTKIPAAFSKRKILRLIWIPWIFMCIIVNNCYVSILVSHINVPHSGQPIAKIRQVLCTKNDGIKAYEAFAAPFEITNETSALSTLIDFHNQKVGNRIIVSRSRGKETKQNYNKAINFWKPSLQFSILFSNFENNEILSARDQTKLARDQRIRSGGNAYLEKLRSYLNDDSCYSLLSASVQPGLDTFSSSPLGYELPDVVLSALTESELDQEN